MNQFEAQLLDQIRKYIRMSKQGGTVGMSVENLMQCVRPPSRFTEGAPGDPFCYAQMFRKLCVDKIKNFSITF